MRAVAVVVPVVAAVVAAELIETFVEGRQWTSDVVEKMKSIVAAERPVAVVFAVVE